MTNKGKLQRRLASLLCAVSLAQPLIAVSAEPLPVQQVPEVTDIAISEQGRLPGRLLNELGQPVAGAELTLWKQGKLTSRCTTDKTGRFEFQVAKGGVHQLSTPHNVQVLRLWQVAAAPPVAKRDLLVVDGDVLRAQGQSGQPGIGSGVYDGRLFQTLTSPWVFAGVIGAGIAIPIAISQHSDGS
ncbi:MAG: hypothetical protein KDB23_01495 [Planctomycetales bacterium]|nr:hypothetical protein [Planctomycetales bacterium]